ncbi:MAG: methylthioribose-1-phosphate isomerase [Planctomycetaceae bacterium]|nr:MAG: methylthioribose-1-phosphate isomerase [Planctomycetaceae bacterium]
MSAASTSKVCALRWHGDERGWLELLDQTALPEKTLWLTCRQLEEVWEAIHSLRVRGAPAIGVAAAYGVVLGCQSVSQATRQEFDARFDQVTKRLADSRPTAVNLFWALERMKTIVAHALHEDSRTLLQRLFHTAQALEEEDRAMCAAMACWGAPLLASCRGVLTHCNTGALATAGEGTALAVIVEAARRDPRLRVFADETRPLLQGARLTAWELLQQGISVTLICDSMAGWVMKQGWVQAVVVGADRIAANGDTANKVGTYGLAQLARVHNIPFYVVAPSSSFDLSLDSGEKIPIEERSPTEITHGFGRRTAPEGCPVYNPAFDVTPAACITAIVTERGVIQPVNLHTIQQMLSR